ncbi:MAG: hypothetical protein HGA39_09270 [Coriobacteriia bacterium]|nr:hypothetical protein [Coriobacteriia bacterium]
MDHHVSGLTLSTRFVLACVYSGPLSWWPAVLRVFGIRVEPLPNPQEAHLSKAEADSYKATRYFLREWIVVAAEVIFLLLWLPVLSWLNRHWLGPLFYAVFDSAMGFGLSRKVSADLAYYVNVAAIFLPPVLIGVAAVVSIWILTVRSLRSAAFGVSIALGLAKENAVVGDQLRDYPRSRYVLRRLLKRDPVQG